MHERSGKLVWTPMTTASGVRYYKCGSWTIRRVKNPLIYHGHKLTWILHPGRGYESSVHPTLARAKARATTLHNSSRKTTTPRSRK